MTSKRTPLRADQEHFWNEWNARHRTSDVDPFMARQRDVALQWAPADGSASRILEVGCGSGWLSVELCSRGSVIGVDLSPEAIEFAKRHSSDATFLCGDFETLAIPGAFDYVVTADTMGHVEDHERFLGRITDLLVPGGLLVLMTQNPFVWNRTSSLAQPARGQIRNWPGLKRLRALLTSRYEILRISSIVPGGDRGFLRMVNSPYVAGLLRHIIGRDRATALYERLLLGRELVLVARRR